MADKIGERVKNELYKHVKENLRQYFDFYIERTDVDDYAFEYYGAVSDEANFEMVIGDCVADVNAKWSGQTLDEELCFTLYDVDVVVTEYDEMSNTTHTHLHFDDISHQ